MMYMGDFETPQKEVQTLAEVQEHVGKDLAVMVYFYNDNCSPCVSLRPKVADLVANSFPEMKLLFVNSAYRDIPAHYQVFSNPTLLVFFDGKEYIRESKYVSVPVLESNINRFYKMVFE